MDNPVQTLQDQMDKPPEESKKLIMAKFGCYCILGVFGVSSMVFLVKPTTAGQIVVLAQIVVGAIAGLIGIYLGAQGTVDFKNSSSLASVVESKRLENKTDITERIEVIRAPKATSFDGDDIP